MDELWDIMILLIRGIYSQIYGNRKWKYGYWGCREEETALLVDTDLDLQDEKVLEIFSQLFI